MLSLFYIKSIHKWGEAQGEACFTAKDEYELALEDESLKKEDETWIDFVRSCMIICT